MGAPLPGDAGVVVTYTVHGTAHPVTTTTVPTSTTVPAASPPPPVVSHRPLPLTGAPITFELAGSFGLLLAGAVAALTARRRRPSVTRFPGTAR